MVKVQHGIGPFPLFLLIWLGDLILISQGWKSNIHARWAIPNYKVLARLGKDWPSNIPVFINPCGSPAICPSYTWAICTEQCWSDKNTCIMPCVPNETWVWSPKRQWELSRWCSNTGNSVKKNEQTMTHPGCLNQDLTLKTSKIVLA